jgi:predicted NBD/HSP70 family sugar kinase
MQKNANVSTIKTANRALILNEIRKSPLSRAKLSRITGLSKSSVTAITGDLIAEGKLQETESVTALKGRRPVLLDINAGNAFAAGIKLHRKSCCALITDAKSEILAKSCVNPSDFASGEEAVVWLCHEIKRIALQQNIPFPELVGVGISSPGPLDHTRGIILNPPNFPLFQNTDIVSIVQNELPIPAVLENNAVLLAMREYFYGNMKRFFNSMFITIADGIGSCIMMDGKIYRGASGFAGELGHISIDRNGAVCSCGNRGCTELYATMTALQNKFNFSDYGDIICKAEAGDTFSLSVLDYEAECLSSAMIDAINLFDLDSVILYGEFNIRPRILLSKIEKIISERCVIAKTHQVSVLASSLPRADESCTTAAVLDQYFNQ